MACRPDQPAECQGPISHGLRCRDGLGDNVGGVRCCDGRKRWRPPQLVYHLRRADEMGVRPTGDHILDVEFDHRDRRGATLSVEFNPIQRRVFAVGFSPCCANRSFIGFRAVNILHELCEA